MSSKEKLPEVWLRGPIAEIPDLLQPVAHALLQSSEELKEILAGEPDSILDKKLGKRASIGFHLRHMTGVLDRMMTYSIGQTLNEEQFEYLRNENSGTPNASIQSLIESFDAKVSEVLAYLKSIKNEELTAFRSVGRKHLPSTVIGLLFHAGEHAQRHLGQLLVTLEALKLLE